MSPLVSVIVPVYNVEAYLRKSIESVLDQTLHDIEIILVDDGSPDGSPQICDEYARKDPRVKVIHKENEGLGMARNTGVEAATGRYVAFLDSDDYMDLDAIRMLYTYANRHDLDVIRAARNEFRKEDKFSHEVADSELVIHEDPKTLRQIALCYFSQPNGAEDRALNLEGSAWAALYNRRLFTEQGLKFVSERELVSEDFIFNYEVALTAKKIGKIHDTLWHYRVNSASLSKSPRKDSIQRAIDYSLYLEKRFREDGYDESSAVYAMGYTVDTMRAHIKNIILSNMPREEVYKWLEEQASNPYFNRIEKEYPINKMPMMHRLFFNTFRSRKFKMLEYLVRSRKFLASLRG